MKQRAIKVIPRPTSDMKLRKKIENKFRSLAKHRKQELTARRMNSTIKQTYFEYIQSNANSFEYFMAAGHGTHVPKEGNIIIPDNVFVVFTTAPGYHGNSRDLLDPNYLAFRFDLDRIKRLVKGTLAPNEIPTLMQGRQWDWRNHIYPPGSTCIEYSMLLFDKHMRTQVNTNKKFVHTMIDAVSGMYHVPNSRNLFENKKPPINPQTNAYIINSKTPLPDVKLSEIIAKAKSISGNKKCIIFVTGCRGDSRIEQEFHAYILSHLELLNLPPTAYSVPVRTSSNLMGRARIYESRIKSVMNTLKMYNETKIKQIVKNLPRPVSNSNITKFGTKYRIFLQSRGITAANYIRNVLRE